MLKSIFNPPYANPASSLSVAAVQYFTAILFATNEPRSFLAGCFAVAFVFLFSCLGGFFLLDGVSAIIARRTLTYMRRISALTDMSYEELKSLPLPYASEAADRLELERLHGDLELFWTGL